MPDLPPLPKLHTIRDRLPLIFPEGTPHRNYLVRDIAARTIFVMFYVGAVEGTGRWLRPNQVARMTNAQAARTDPESRAAWSENSLKPLKSPIRGRWYADNTREPIRDETLRAALAPLGAITERSDLPITSASPRYALASDFAALFLCEEAQVDSFVVAWQAAHLTAGARARIAVVRHGAVLETDGRRVPVRFPNGELRHMAAGPSSVISRAVVEDFAPRFLLQPGVILLSESRDKMVARDDTLARAIGIEISTQKVLPDVLLADLGVEPPLLVFVEVVSTDGAVTQARRDALLRLATSAGYQPEQAAFVTAFLDQASPGYKRVVSDISWGTFVWFASEPDRIIAYHQISRSPVPLSTLLGGR